MSYRCSIVLALACILPFAAGCSNSRSLPAPQPVGSIEGSIAFSGTLPKTAAPNMEQDDECAYLQRRSRHQRQDHMLSRTMPPVFLWISSNIEGRHFKHAPVQVVLTQLGCRFHPQLLGVMPGQPVDFTTSDLHTTHFRITPHVAGNLTLNLTIEPRRPGKIHSFTHPELLIPVTSPGHPWMHAYINVVPTPYFTVSGPQGYFRLPELPAGTYTLSAIRPGFPLQSQSVTIQPGAASHVSFTFSAASAPLPDRK